ncbi:GNAT family N-acetyltransferase [Streptomyces sp. col6]|uniref:GNAT family N-acetyltransferase n=1 Tax=Streptomyces sp. col6 TaxID=2478958 RepID=UPI0011CDD6DA|nr:GNAT family N-acetyltransferase [Streptomyces sp. col6]TXS07601.1 GNAT family N-acetyltransferase [Streptomyces sp. col6]
MTEIGTGVPGYVFRAYRGAPDHEAMAAVRAGSAEHDGLDADSVVEGLPDAEEIGTASAALADPARDQVLVEHDGAVVGYAAVRWWRERDGTQLYLHRGHLLPGHRGRGVGAAMVAWAEEHIRRLVAEQGTAETAVFGANAMAGEREAARLLTDTGYQRVFSLVELELPDLGALPGSAEPPAGIRLGPIGPDSYRSAWRTVVDSYREAGFTEEWPYARFVAKADPACWRAAWQGEEMAGVALCSLRARDRTTGEVEELSVRDRSRRLGVGRAVLLAGLRALRDHGATRARLYTGTANPYRSYDLYESVGFRRRNEYVRYRKPLRS